MTLKEVEQTSDNKIIIVKKKRVNLINGWQKQDDGRGRKGSRGQRQRMQPGERVKEPKKKKGGRRVTK